MKTITKSLFIFIIINLIYITAFSQEKSAELKPEEKIEIKDEQADKKENLKLQEQKPEKAEKPIEKNDNPVEKAEKKAEPEIKEKSIEKAQAVKSDNTNAGRLFITLTGFGGLSLTSGEFSGSGNQEMNAGGSGGVFLNVGYYLFENGGIYLGLEYASKQSIIKRTLLNMSMNNTYNFQFMELFLGYRGEYKWFFFTAGFYYGFKAAPWTEEVNLNGNSTTTIITTAYPTNCHDEFGIQLAVGATIKITSFLNIDVSISYETSFINAYDNLDKLRTNLISLNAGVTFKIDLVKKKG